MQNSCSECKRRSTSRRTNLRYRIGNLINMLNFSRPIFLLQRSFYFPPFLFAFSLPESFCPMGTGGESDGESWLEKRTENLYKTQRLTMNRQRRRERKERGKKNINESDAGCFWNGLSQGIIFIPHRTTTQPPSRFPDFYILIFQFLQGVPSQKEGVDRKSFIMWRKRRERGVSGEDSLLPDSSVVLPLFW